jgi:hypothetical protein
MLDSSLVPLGWHSKFQGADMIGDIALALVIFAVLGVSAAAMLWDWS